MNETPILPESMFGRVLTRLAMKSNTIVEIGCGTGEGSSICLALGVVRPEQRMFSIDSSREMITQAEKILPNEQLTFLCGTVLKPEECDITGKGVYGQTRDKMIPTQEPRMSQAIEELRVCSTLPYVGDQIPVQIDLLLLDGGEFTSRFEYLKLFKRCRVIALDDTRKDIGLKNFQNYMGLTTPLSPTVKWKLLFNRPFERRGWSVFCRTPQRVKGKLFPACQDENDIDQALE